MKRGLVMLTLLLWPVQSLAISPDTLHSVLYDSVYYDQTQAGFCALQGATTLIGSDNHERAFNFFVQKGLTPEQAAGVVGNLVQESYVDPNSKQGNGPGRGIAQWSQPGRWDTLVKFAADRGLKPQDLGAQLDFLWFELTSNPAYGLAQLKQAATIQEATTIFSTKFERPGKPQLDLRIKYAIAILKQYAGASQGVDRVADKISNCASLVGTGQNTKYIDGFLIYSQFDPAWKDQPYSSSTIGQSGCGPTAMAMIISNLTGQQVIPVETAAYAASQGLYIPGQGSKPTIGPVLAAHWLLKSTPLAKDVYAIATALQAGGLVIASGQGPKPWTPGGHILVIRGVTADGKFKIGDSGHSDTSSLDWDPQQLVSNMREGSIYAIYK